MLLTWENEGVKANILPESRSTFQVDELAVWSQDLTVEVGGHGVVSHTGSAALRLLADRTGLTAALSKALRRAVSRGECTTSLTWDPREGSHRPDSGQARGYPMRDPSLRALTPGQAGGALTV